MSLCVKATVAAKIAVKEPTKITKFEAKNELLKKILLLIKMKNWV